MFLLYITTLQGVKGKAALLFGLVFFFLEFSLVKCYIGKYFTSTYSNMRNKVSSYHAWLALYSLYALDYPFNNQDCN